jgi:predicted ATPase
MFVADIVGSQFLGFENATAVTDINGKVPTMDELVDFLASIFVKIADFSKLTGLFVDDFQWVDAFSWRILRSICQKAGNVLLICSTRSHDKQALRRISNAATPDGKAQLQMIEVSLGPFDFDDIRDLIAVLYLQPRRCIPQDICNEIYQRTGGLPVFVVQLLENLKRMKALHMVDGTLQWKSGQQAKLVRIAGLWSVGACGLTECDSSAACHWFDKEWSR